MPISYFSFQPRHKSTERTPTGEKNRAEPGKINSLQKLSMSAVVTVANARQDYMEKVLSDPSALYTIMQDFSFQQHKSDDVPPAGEKNPAGSRGVDKLRKLAAYAVVTVASASPDCLKKVLSQTGAAQAIAQNLDIWENIELKDLLEPGGAVYDEFDTAIETKFGEIVKLLYGERIDKTHPELFLQKREEVRSFREKIHNAGMDKETKEFFDIYDRFLSYVSLRSPGQAS